MKKKILSEVKSIAELLLVEDFTQDTTILKEKIGYLYEKLSVLDYLEKSISDTSNTEKEILNDQSLDSKSYREKNWFSEPKPVPPSTFNEKELAEPMIEKIKDLVAEIPEDSQKIEALLEQVLPKQQNVKNDLEEFATTYQDMPVFERKQTAAQVSEKPSNGNNGELKPKSLNDSLGKEIIIGLNDRLAFIQHLFNGNAEDYTRVLSQINTLSSLDEVAYFIKVKVKPDYNYWLNKDEYAARFMALIERKFV